MGGVAVRARDREVLTPFGAVTGQTLVVDGGDSLPEVPYYLSGGRPSV